MRPLLAVDGRGQPETRSAERDRVRERIAPPYAAGQGAITSVRGAHRLRRPEMRPRWRSHICNGRLCAVCRRPLPALIESRCAGMAELADAADSKSAEGNLMGVRFPLPAPTKCLIPLTNSRGWREWMRCRCF